MNASEAARLTNAAGETAKNTSDLIALLHTELTLTAVAQSLSFAGVTQGDVMAVEIRVRKTGSPTDDSHIARFTQRLGDAPTASHGMYLGDGDLYTVTGNYNVSNLKIIATQALGHIANLIYYGYAQ